MTTTQLNFDVDDIDSIYDYLLNHDSLPDSLKKKLYFLQSDQ